MFLDELIGQAEMTADQLAQLTLLVYAAIAVGLLLASKRRCRDGWRVWLLFLVERLYVAFLSHWRANGRCPFPDSGGAIILSNHRSPIDPLMAWVNSHLRHDENARSIRVIAYLMAREYYEQPGLVGWISRAMQSIPVDRDGRDARPTRETLRRLEAGDLIGIFPEGGLNANEGLRTANLGVAFLALRSGVPIFPVYIHGVPCTENMLAPFFHPSRVRVTYGTPIDLSHLQGQRKTRELLQAVTDALMHRLAELGGVKYLPDQQADTSDARNPNWVGSPGE